MWEWLGMICFPSQGNLQLETHSGRPRQQHSPQDHHREGASEGAEKTLQEAQAAHDVEVGIVFEVERSLELFLMPCCCTHKSLRAGPCMLLLLPVFVVHGCVAISSW